VLWISRDEGVGGVLERLTVNVVYPETLREINKTDP